MFRYRFSQNSSSTSSDSGVTSDALGIVDRPSGTLRNHGPRTWQSPRSQSTITVTEMDPEEEASEDDASFGAPLSRSSSHKHPPSSSFVSSSPMIHAENSGFPRRSPRRGNTYNPTALRGPQPVRVFSLEHGWTVPPRSPSRFEDSSENEPPPYDEDMFEDSDELPPPNQFSMRSPRRSFRELDILEGIEPQVRSFRMSQDQESSTSVTELETVEEEDENKDTEVAAAKSNTPSGPSSHSEGSSLTELGAPSEPDAPPSYTASVHPSMSLASVPAIKDTPPPEQPSTISPMNLGEQEHTLETAEPLSENPLDASHLSDVQAGIVLLPDNLTHQAFIRDPVLRRFCVGYHDETQTSFSSMERSIFHFRDFVASQNSMSERDILARDDKYDDDSSEQASEDMEAVKETPYAHPGSTTLQIAEPVVQNTPASAAQSGTNPGPMSPGDLNSTKPSTRKRQEQGTELLPGLSIKQARTYEEKREGEVSPMDTYGEGEVRPNHTESEEFNGRRHQRTPEHDTEMDDPEASYPDDIPTFFFADISEINKHYSAQPTQSNEGWSAPGDWCCRFCGRLNAKIKTECYGCLSKEAHMVPKVGHISETQQSQNKKVLSARSAQELHTQTVLNSEALEDLGPQPEKSHLAVSSPESPQSDEPQATKERKRKRKY